MADIVKLRPIAAKERAAAAAQQFAEFWADWPKKVAKDAAERAWYRLTAEEHGKAIATLPAHKKKWTERGDPDFIPHPASWLNGRRFNDQLECQLDVIYCKWAGCQRSGHFTRGSGIYCRIHYDALMRGEVPNGR